MMKGTKQARPGTHRRAMTRRALLTSTAVGAAAVGGGALGALAWVADAPAPARAAAGPKPLVIGIDTDPLTLDTRLTTPTQAYPMVQHICEPLTFRQTNGVVLPYLAESWQREGALVMRLNLRKGVKFHNGEPFDAESVKYSLDSVVTPDVFPKTTGQKRAWLKAIDSVEIVDASTVRLHLKYPSRAVLSYLSLFGMLPPQAARTAGERFGLQPVGTGPYRFVEYVPGTHLAMEPNASWWGGRAKNGGVTFRFLPENATRIAALEAGEVSWINNLPPDQVARIKGNSGLRVNETMSTRIMYLGIVMDRAPFNKAEARQAVNIAIDKQAIVAQLMGGHGAVASSVYSPAILYYKAQPAYRYDKAQAQRLFAEAGVDRSTPVKYTYPTGRYLNDKQVGEAVGDMLTDAGLTLQSESPEWGVLFDDMAKGYANLFLVGYADLTLDPDYALNWLFISDTSWMRYKNPQVDTLVTKGDATTDSTQAQSAYQDAQQTIWHDAPTGFLYLQPEIHGTSANFVGDQPRPDEYFLFWNNSLR